MLNLYTATGHFNYAKSSRLHFQTMLRLEYGFLWIHRQYRENGFHCVWFSEKHWAKLTT